MNPTEQQLLMSVLAEWEPRLLRRARALVRHADQAADLVQGAILCLLEHPPAKRTSRAIGAFLFMAIKRLARHERRRRKPGAQALQIAINRARLRMSVEERGEPVVAQAALADTLRAVAARVTTLTELERRVVLLVHGELRSTSEAARQLGTTRKSIDRALRRAHPKLSPLLAASDCAAFAASSSEGPSGVARASMEVADIDLITPRDDEATA